MKTLYSGIDTGKRAGMVILEEKKGRPIVSYFNVWNYSEEDLMICIEKQIPEMVDIIRKVAKKEKIEKVIVGIEIPTGMAKRHLNVVGFMSQMQWVGALRRELAILSGENKKVQVVVVSPAEAKIALLGEGKGKADKEEVFWKAIKVGKWGKGLGTYMPQSPKKPSENAKTLTDSFAVALGALQRASCPSKP